MKQGKLTNEQLREFILNKLTTGNKETVIGAGVGEDCCAIDTGDMCIVSTDPITASGHQAGTLAIHINANDIASAGARPIAALVTILIPPSSTEGEVGEVVAQLTQTAGAMGIDITGGHTEVTDSVNRIIVSVTMIGKPVVKGKVMRTADMRPGNEIVMTKYAGLEGTAIIAQDYADELTYVLDADDRRTIEGILTELSVVPEGVIAAGLEGVTAMHDVTEGGVTGAVSEMCEASGTGAGLYLDKIPVLPVTEKLCDHYGIDVYSLISSGSMLIAAEDGEAVVRRLRREGIRAAVIGKATDTGVCYDERGRALTPACVDELYKVIEKQR